MVHFRRREKEKYLLASRRCAMVAVLALPLVSLSAQAGRLEDVRASRTLRVCSLPDLPPISYRNAESGRPAGLDADLARELARDLGVQLKFVDTPFAKVADQLLQNRCDLAVSALGLAVSRGEKLRFTRPHLRGGICAVVARDNGRIKEWSDLDKKGLVVAVAKGSVAEGVARESLKLATIQTSDSNTDRIHDVEAHRVDALLAECQESQQLQEGGQWARWVAGPAGTLPRNLSYAWAMAADDDRWYARIEYFISEIRRDGRLRTAARRYGLETLAILE